MPSNKANLTIQTQFKDGASAPARRMGENLQKTSQGMADGFGKSASVMNFASSQLGTMSGAAADAGAKLGEIGGLVFSGSPLMIGIGALTGLVLAAQAAYDFFSDAAENAAKALEEHEKAIASSKDALSDWQNKIKGIQGEMRGMMDVSREQQNAEAQRAAAAEARALQELELEQKVLLKKKEAADLSVFDSIRMSDADEQRLELVEKEIEKQRKVAAAAREHAEELETLNFLKGESEKMDKRRAAAKKVLAAAQEQENEAHSEWVAMVEADRANDAQRAQARLALEQRIESQMTQVRSANVARRIKLTNAQADAELRAAQETERANMEKFAAVEARANAVSNAAIQIADAAFSAEQDAGKAALKAFIAIAKKHIVAAAATGAAKAAAGSAFGGPIASAVTSAAVFTAISALETQLPKAARGGVVTGGQPGRDSVPVLLQPGEIVVPTQKAAPARAGAAQTQQMGSTVNNFYISLNAFDVTGIGRPVMDKIAREIGRSLEDLQSRGMVSL